MSVMLLSPTCIGISIAIFDTSSNFEHAEHMLTTQCDMSFPSRHISRTSSTMSHHRPSSICILIPQWIPNQNHSKHIQDCTKECPNQMSLHPFLSYRISGKLYKRALALEKPHVQIGKHGPISNFHTSSQLTIYIHLACWKSNIYPFVYYENTSK